MFLQTYLPAPTLVTIGAFSVHWYGLLMAISVIVGYWLVRKIMRERAEEVQKFDEILGWLIIGGLVGARIFDVFIFEWWYFTDHLGDIYKLWQGGLSWHGALLGGGVVLWLWCRRYSRSFLSVLDWFAPALALGQAIGRWGNYFNQELFGLPTSLPWGIPIDQLHRPLAYASANYFHPTFLYESLALVVIFIILFILRKKPWPAGKLFGFYLLLASVVRLGLEFLRIDEQVLVAGMRVGLLVAIAGLLVGGWLVLRTVIRNPPRPAGGGEAISK